MTENINQIIKNIKNGDEVNSGLLLNKVGFKEPEKSYKNISILLHTRQFKEIEKDILEKSLQSPDPDLALNNFERLSSSLSAEDIKQILQNKQILNTIFTICGGSQFLSNILFRRPLLIKWLITEENILKSLSYEEKIADVRIALNDVDDIKSLQKALREFKHKDYLRVGARDLIGEASLEEVAREISDLASVTLQGAYEFLLSSLKAEYGSPLYEDENGEKKEADFVVLGMGKLGGRELNFSSDIDMIF